MFEMFTERARKCMVLARQQALVRGSEFIGTEHVLLAIMMEGGGVGWAVLKKMGLTLDRIEKELLKASLAPSGRALTLSQIPFAPRALRSLELAIEEASTSHSPTVGTGHLALGLSKETEGIAYQVITALGVEEGRLRFEVERLMAKMGQQDDDVLRSKRDYDKVYRNTPSANIVFRDNCKQCGQQARAEELIYEGVIWNPSVTCPACGHVWIVAIQVTQVNRPASD